MSRASIASGGTDARQRLGVRGILLVVAGAAALALFATPLFTGAPPAAMHTAAITVLIVALWVSAVLPEFYTAIIFFFLAAVLAVAPLPVVFSGFQSSAAWMVFSGLVIALAVRTSGLGDRLARALIAVLPASYFGYLAGGAFAGVALAFFIPATAARVAILLPIMLSVADRLGLSERGRAGVALATTAGTLYSSFGILPSNIPNLVMYGAAKSIYDIEISYSDWLVADFPVVGLVSVLVVPVVVWLLFRDRQRQVDDVPVHTSLPPEARNLACILAVVLALWMTDSWHGISPGWVALGAAIACMMPGLGNVAPATLFDKVNLGAWIYTAGIIGVGAVISATGLGDMLGARLFSLVALEPGAHAWNFAAITGIGMGLGLIATIPGEPGIIGPLLREMSNGTGWPLTTVVLAQVPAWATALFPYQYPPMVVAIAIGQLRVRHALALMLAMTVIAWLVILPLQILWFHLLGLFG